MIDEFAQAHRIDVAVVETGILILMVQRLVHQQHPPETIKLLVAAAIDGYVASKEAAASPPLPDPYPAPAIPDLQDDGTNVVRFGPRPKP